MDPRKLLYRPEIGEDICEHLANGGSLRGWCRMEGHPSFNTVYKWLEAEEDFADAYARARERQAHNDADQLNDLAAQIGAGAIGQAEGRVMADILKWTASRRAPKSYGDKVSVTGSEDGAPLIVTWMPATK